MRNEVEPDYYVGEGGHWIEPIVFIEAQGLGFHEGNIVKYVCRYKKKSGKTDLLKAKWYIERLLEKIK